MCCCTLVVLTSAGQAIPQPLPDRRPLPAGAFDDQEALLQEEAATHYWCVAATA